MAGNELKYGVQTYNPAGDVEFTSEYDISNVVIVGFKDIDTRSGEFFIPPDNIPPNKSFFYFPTFNLFKGVDAQPSPLFQFHPIYTEGGNGSVHGFWWGTFHLNDTLSELYAINQEAPQIRVYYGYY